MHSLVVVYRMDCRERTRFIWSGILGRNSAHSASPSPWGQLRVIGGMAALWVQSQQVLILAPVASLISWDKGGSLEQRRRVGAMGSVGQGLSGSGLCHVCFSSSGIGLEGHGAPQR